MTSPVRYRPIRRVFQPLLANLLFSFLDLKAQYEVKLEEGLDTFVVIDGLPVVPEENRQKLIKFLLRKLNAVGHTSEDAVFMPINEKNMSEGYVPVICGMRAVGI